MLTKTAERCKMVPYDEAEPRVRKLYDETMIKDLLEYKA